VFGQVIDGFNVVKAMEACGSRGSGETSADVMIGKCGEVDTSAGAGGAGALRTATVRAVGRLAAAHAPSAARGLSARAAAGVRVALAPAARRAIAAAGRGRAPRALPARALALAASRALVV